MGRRVVSSSSSRSKSNNRGGRGRGRGRATASSTGGGVLTRAKSLALYGVTTTSSSLDLRTRRLDKVVDSSTRLRVSKRKLPHPPKSTNPSSLKVTAASANDAAAAAAATPGDNAPPPPAASDDARTTRESTPCNLIRDSSILSAPGSSNKHTSKSTAQQTGGPGCQRVVPSEREINDLFGKPEELQQKNFTEKYNFDPVTEQPLPGRYEWEKLDPPK